MIFLCGVLNNLSVVGCIGERLVCGLIGNSRQSREGLWHYTGPSSWWWWWWWCGDDGDDDGAYFCCNDVCVCFCLNMCNTYHECVYVFVCVSNYYKKTRAKKHVGPLEQFVLMTLLHHSPFDFVKINYGQFEKCPTITVDAHCPGIRFPLRSSYSSTIIQQFCQNTTL